ncbi:Ig-like domain-containing protein [Luteolibacter arcticus]|uniref:Ig-like domain-containing protein n=1 Tax=Luteolibacter arcticus TaxID=1581411 RepID=A0ABT3GNP1_9BACT|nr:Ig-like domain-containing protein [Luteolibacter arcticus]MCW1925141.1 Ig-like domain-containing protein [Luteolibacter arcticus]
MNPEKPKCRGIARTTLLVLACLWAGFPLRASGQAGGLDAPQAVGAFFNNAFPQAAPGSSSGWQAVNAFPNLTFVDPLWLTEIPGTNEFLLVGKNGQLWRFENNPAVTQAQAVKVLEWAANTETADDQGFYSLAFHPEFGQAGSPNANYAYVCYSRRTVVGVEDSNRSYWRVSRFTWEPEFGRLDAGSEFVLINQYDRCRWHNGGAMFFGNDGFLYINCGDGGDSTEGGGLTGADGALSRTQKLNGGLFSGVFRIDVDNDPAKSHPIRRQPQSPANKPAGWPASATQGYGIPNDNPWLDTGGSILEEYWSLGLRSPHTMHYDAETGDIWIGDVGEGAREEMTRAPKGSNGQWGFREGNIAGPGAVPGTMIGTSEPPLLDYNRATGTCIIGGMRYRGAKWSEQLGGKLLYADHVRGRIWTATLDSGGGAPVIDEIFSGLKTGGKVGIANFCTDSTGEIYMPMVNGTDQPGGTIFKLTTAGVANEPPALLSQTGVFSNLATLTTAPGVVPYNVANPLWSDAAAKKRWIILPNNGVHDSAAEKIVFSEEGNWTFPAGTVFVKHFEVALDEANPASVKRLETRFLICTEGGGKYGVTYKWNAAGTDAELLTSGLAESYDVTLAGGGVETRNWDYPSRADCLLCHNDAAGQALGVRTHALNKNFHYAATGREANQLATFNALGMFDVTLTAAQIEDFIEARALDDESAPIEHRVRSYLDSNCSHCHQPGATVSHFDARLGTPLKVQGLINGVIQGHFNLGPDGRYMKPGDTDLSAVHVRLANVGNGAAMPPLAKNVVDQEAVDLLQEYLESLSEPDFVLTPQSPVARYVRLTATSAVANGPWTAVGEFSILDGNGAQIPISEVSVHDFDSQEVVAEVSPATRAIDGNPATHWHTAYANNNVDPMPHHLTIDVGSIRSIGGFVYVPRQGSQNGRIANYQVHYSTDAATWIPMTSGTWGNDTVTKTYDALVGHRKARCEIAGPSGTVGGPFDVTVVFDYDVTDFTESDLQVAGGTVTGLRGKGYYYVARISPTAADVSVSVPANAVNPGGFGSRASATLGVDFADTAPPVPVFTGVPVQVSGSFQVGLEFGELVTGLDAADFRVFNGTLGSIVPNGNGYTITVTPSAASTVGLELRDGAVTDLSANRMGEGAFISTMRVPWQLARDAEEGTITGGFVIEDPNATATGGRCLWVPQGSRNNAVTLNTALKVSYSVIIPRTGEYLVHGLVRADDASSDSFFIGFDGGTPSEWHTNQIAGQVGTGQFHWDVANSSRAPATNPTIFNLTAGAHTLELYGRDDGTRIDRLEIRPLRPLPLWSGSGPALVIGRPFTATLSFSEAVTGLTAADVSITGGQILSLTGTGDTYFLQVQSNAATVALTLPQNVVLDSAGSGNHASETYTVGFRTPYEDWALDHETNGSAASQLADEDVDGIAKLLEFAFNLDPASSDRATYDPAVIPGAGLPRMIVGEGPALSLQYLRRKGVAGLSYTAQFGSSLDDFANATGTAVVESIDASWERVTILDSSGGASRFGRVVVTLAAP